MAINIYYFSFDKKRNSTAQPDISDLTNIPHDSVTLKEGCSYLNPVFLLYKGTGFDPQTGGFYWNYLYVPRWTRYYYIDDIVFNEGFLEFHCRQDTLATWKTKIGNATLYALRASNNADGNIIDTMYPAKADSTFRRTENGSVFTIDGTSFTTSDGIFMLGIISKLGDAGSVKYHAFNTGGMASLCGALMNDSILTTGTNPIDLNDASLILQKSLMNPLQYIVSSIWLPISMDDFFGNASMTLDVWDWSVTLGTGRHKSGIYTPNLVYTKTIPLSKHPQAATRGAYLNVAPYTQYWLEFPPFGTIELDTTLLKDVSDLTIKVILDIFTGGGSLILSNGIVEFNRIETQVGIPIQISQVIKDFIGTAQAGLGGIGGVVGGLMTGDIAGAIASGVNGILDATVASQPKVSSIGSSGSFNTLYGKPYINAQHFNIVDGYNDELGRPYCKTVQPKNIGGYLKCLGDVPIYGTIPEHEEIQEFINNGFYYE